MSDAAMLWRLGCSTSPNPNISDCGRRSGEFLMDEGQPAVVAVRAKRRPRWGSRSGFGTILGATEGRLQGARFVGGLMDSVILAASPCKNLPARKLEGFEFLKSSPPRRRLTSVFDLKVEVGTDTPA